MSLERIERASGRELDALVAEHVLGWTCFLTRAGNCWPEFDVTATPPDWSATRYQRVPEYSTDGNAMLAVLEGMRGIGFHGFIARRPSGDVRVHFWKVERINGITLEKTGGRSTSWSMPEAVCRAALLAVMQKEAR